MISRQLISYGKLLIPYVKLYPLVVVVLVFLPKIDLVSIPGYHQGIRIEDLIFLFFAIYFCIHFKLGFIQHNYQFRPIVIFITYVLFGNFVGHLSGLTIIPFVLLRFIEYIALIFLLNHLNVKGLFLKRLSFIYLLINFLVVLLQHNDVVGSFSSFGYLPPDHWFNARAYGILGGSWELGVVASLSFFIFLKYEKNKFNIFVTLFMTTTLVILAEGRGNFIAFIFTIIFIYLSNYRLQRVTGLLICGAILTIISKIYFPDWSSSAMITDYDIDFKPGKIIDLLKNFILYNEMPTRSEIMYSNPKLLSFLFRLQYWSGMYQEYKTNMFTQMFGTGATEIYTDSLLIRLWFTTGWVGIILAIFLGRNMKVYQLIFFVLSGITLDIFMSFKIVLLSLLLNLKVIDSDENSS